MRGLPHGFRHWRDHAEIEAAAELLSQDWRGQTALERQWLSSGQGHIDGFCVVCGEVRGFGFGAVHPAELNWRESLACDGCGLINRWRASIHLFRLLGRPEGPVYLTEQSTPLHARLSSLLPGLIGSEYLGPGIGPGELRDWNGMALRHEDITALSFADASQSAVLSFDVLEHVPDYLAAVREFARVLMPGGYLLLTAPFLLQDARTLVRARLAADGAIEHLLPPMYHGDPLKSEGVLCFQDFGWDLVEAMREAGLADAGVVTCWAPSYGYLGSAQPFIVARRPLP